MGFQSVIIEGHVGKDPEMRYTTSGNAVTSFSVAVGEKYGDTETTEWFSVVCWNKTAETMGQYLRKGRHVLVQGKMRTRSWEKSDGQKAFRTELIANTIQFLERAKDDS